jgi:hypothetical protein
VARNPQPASFQVAIEIAFHTDKTVKQLINTALQLDPPDSQRWPSLKTARFGITSAGRNKTGIEMSVIQPSQVTLFWLRASQERRRTF